LTEEKEVKKL